MSMGARMQDFAERYTAAWCSQNAASVAAFFSPSGALKVNDDAPSVGTVAITAVAQGFMDAFSDLTVAMEALEPDGKRWIYRWRLTGTNDGPGGTGKRVNIIGFEHWRIGEDGLIADSLGNFDAEEYERQLADGV